MGQGRKRAVFAEERHDPDLLRVYEDCTARIADGPFVMYSSGRHVRAKRHRQQGHAEPACRPHLGTRSLAGARAFT